MSVAEAMVRLVKISHDRGGDDFRLWYKENPYQDETTYMNDNVLKLVQAWREGFDNALVSHKAMRDGECDG